MTGSSVAYELSNAVEPALANAPVLAAEPAEGVAPSRSKLAPPMTRIADLHADFIGIMQNVLTKLGVPYDPNLDETQLSLIFWNIRLRLVGSVPRKVNWAKEFTCPPQMRAGLDALIEKFEKGEDVNPHQSNAWVLPGNRAFNDRLFDNWRIKHFHLGLNGQRGDDCLFAVVTASDVYAVAVYPHGRYGENEMVERLKANWPELVRGSKAALKPTGAPLDNAQTIAARKRATPLTELADGSTYGPLGGGTTSSGVGGRVVDVMDRAFDRLNEWQAWLDSNAAAEIQKAQVKGIVFGNPPTLKLIVDSKNDFYAWDEAADWGIKLGQLLDLPID
ncbi:MAG TPA: hypothetical protein VJN18_25000 [Polyangiaceae bacterium]|nr:hypothetical protein [Polyangiaceae bacterium]